MMMMRWVVLAAVALLWWYCAKVMNKCFQVFWWTPRRQARMAQLQGLAGPKPSLFFPLGNVLHIKRLRQSVPDRIHSFHRHDLILPQILPEHLLWSLLYGKRHIIWWGPIPHIVTTDMDMLKEILSSKHALTLGKPAMLQRFLEPITGAAGLILANGEVWAHERRVIGPAFHTDRLKGLAEVMVGVTVGMAEKWCGMINGGSSSSGSGSAEIEVEQEMTRLAADIIARTQFGSSYEKGKEVFRRLEELKNFVFEHGHLLIIPGMSYIPIPPFIRLWRMTAVIERSIREIIEERMMLADGGGDGGGYYGDDLLGLMLSEKAKKREIPSKSASGGHGEQQHKEKKKKMVMKWRWRQKQEEENKEEMMMMQQLVDECKTFFFAGHETTAQLLTWALLLLAHNPSWQHRARADIIAACNSNQRRRLHQLQAQTTPLPDFASINKMKILEMILYETLRLFAPANSIVRAAQCDMKVGDLEVPKGMCFWIPIAAIHMDQELWGEGVNEFNPERFAEGISKAAKHPMAFLPFAHGPRNCIGQSFALMEAKLVLSTLLPRFSFAPSPSYIHSPQLIITTRPKYGAPIIVTTL